MISLILSLKLYLHSLVYHRNIFGYSSKVFGNLRKSSDIFGNFRKFSENVRERSSGLHNNFGKSSEIFGKSSKTPSSACLYNKKNITRRLEDMNFIFSWQKQYFTHSLRSFVKYCFATRKYNSYLRPTVQYPLFIIWQDSRGKSERSDWFFLGRDFAIRTVSMETVQCYVFFVLESWQIQTTKRKRLNTLIFERNYLKRLIFYRAYNKNEEHKYSRSEF